MHRPHKHHVVYSPKALFAAVYEHLWLYVTICNHSHRENTRERSETNSRTPHNLFPRMANDHNTSTVKQECQSAAKSVRAGGVGYYVVRENQLFE